MKFDTALLGRAIFAALTCSLLPAHATPFVPAHGNAVIERLPSRLDPVQHELRQLRAQLTKEPQNLPLAHKLAQRYIALARQEADPRYLGYAEAALQPWWQQAAPPPEVRLLRATLRQSTHQFALALADLDALLKQDRGNAQAWLTQATILQVQGEYAAAKQSCARLFRLAPDLIIQACLQSVASLNGDGAASYLRLQQSLTQHPDAAPELRLWALTLLGEMAERQGQPERAESHFRAALQSTPEAGKDSYLLAAYADFLLQQQRAPEVLILLAAHTRADNLLLRYALALQATRSPMAQQHIGTLQQRFDAAMRRGDTVHQREQARFALHLQGDAKLALQLAQQNWQVQKEPSDLRILLEAAKATGQTEAQNQALAWIKQAGLQDHTLQALLQSLRSRS